MPSYGPHYRNPQEPHTNYAMWFFTLALAVAVGVFFSGLFLALAFRAYLKN